MRYAVHGERAVMPVSALRAILYRERRQLETIQTLRRRLEARETLLTLALHELAVERKEKDPLNFIFRRKRGGAIEKH